MWHDNDTDLDYLNFTGVADTVGEIIAQADGRPISVGISGPWGSGKSSMIKLVRRALERRAKPSGKEFVFVEFNAWLYQGYDDARAALMEVIGAALAEEAVKRETGIDRAKEFLGRVRWLRLTKILTSSAAAIYAAHAGAVPPGLLGSIFGLGGDLAAGAPAKAAEDAEKVGDDLTTATPSLLAPKKDVAPPKEIDDLRRSFEETLSALGITLVVLIDDLDRCLPETTISTLEAMRLFLFLKNTAFVIAADAEMIKYAVKRHFDGVKDELATSYFDKLVQVPIRVPPLGTQEVRGYMMLLSVENSQLNATTKEMLRTKICDQLAHTWQGKRVDRAFMETLHSSFGNELIAQFDTADRLAPLMATASGIMGNPRLVKRFLNALAIRMAISRAHGVGVDEAVLAKMLLFERLGNSAAYGLLAKSVAQDSEGKPRFLADWEAAVNEGRDPKLEGPWDDEFVREWLALPPMMADLDLRGVLYVSREHAPLITPQDRLSSEAAELLGAMLEHPDMAASLKPRLLKVSRPDANVIMDRLLDRAHREQEWGAPKILDACIAVAEADPSQGSRLAAFLAERPAAQIKANIVPKISGQPWALTVFESWEKAAGLSAPVKAAIKEHKLNGNVILK